ncbi:MAG: helix-turn-helix transcriptional regulator [Coriobacteriales bacterium]|jgi:DNA-binding CsgD family transcriptional regulator|nr:helix-turn-helix transcriptional regulator [Coriobacteriales bacterium]
MLKKATQEEASLGRSKLLASVSKRLLPLILVLPRVWSLFAYRSLGEQDPSIMTIFYLGEALVAVFVTVVVSERFKRIGRLLSAIAYSRTLVLILGASPAAIVLFGSHTNIALVPIAATLSGMCRVWLYFLCITVLGKLDSRHAIVYILVSFSLAVLFRLPLELLPLDVASLLVIPIPLLCVAICRKAKSIAGDSIANPRHFKSLRHFVPYIVVIFVISMVLGCYHNTISIHVLDLQVMAYGILYKTLVPLILLVFFIKNSQFINLGHMSLLTLLFVLTMLVVSFFFAGNVLIDEMTSDYARWTFEMLLFVSLVVLARRTDTDVFRVFGVGWATAMVGMALGVFVCAPPGFDFESSSMVLVFIYTLVVMTVVVVLFNLKNTFDFRLMGTRTNQKQSAQETYEAIHAKCLELRNIEQLTQRELEILPLICLGLSKSAIANHLVISENTVRTHAKNIYRKLNIHSRQDLLDLLWRI